MIVLLSICLKIWVLRDIISELECQADLRAKREADLEQQVTNLKDLLEQQGQTHHQLAEEVKIDLKFY